MDKTAIMSLAKQEALKTMRNGDGGPFGAAIAKDGYVVALGSNLVLGSHDPTAHAEIVAIRRACEILGTHDLTGYDLYATGYPCPMCLGAIIWANIKKVYYGCRPEDAEQIGFRDDFIYRFIKDGCSDGDILGIVELDRDECLVLFQEYATGGIIY